MCLSADSQTLILNQKLLINITLYLNVLLQVPGSREDCKQ